MSSYLILKILFKKGCLDFLDSPFFAKIHFEHTLKIERKSLLTKSVKKDGFD